MTAREHQPHPGATPLIPAYDAARQAADEAHAVTPEGTAARLAAQAQVTAALAAAERVRHLCGAPGCPVASLPGRTAHHDIGAHRAAAHHLPTPPTCGATCPHRDPNAPPYTPPAPPTCAGCGRAVPLLLTLADAAYCARCAPYAWSKFTHAGHPDEPPGPPFAWQILEEQNRDYTARATSAALAAALANLGEARTAATQAGPAFGSILGQINAAYLAAESAHAFTADHLPEARP